MAQKVKHLPAMWKTWVRSLGWEDFLKEGMATHSSILAWRTPGQRSLVGIAMGPQRVGHDWPTKSSTQHACFGATMTELSNWNRCHVTHKLFKQKFAKPSRIFAWVSPYLGFGANATPSERHVSSPTPVTLSHYPLNFFTGLLWNYLTCLTAYYLLTWLECVSLSHSLVGP